MSSADSGRVAVRGPAALSVEDLADPVLVIDLQGALRYANESAAETLGWDPVELLGTSVLELLHPDDLNLARSALQTVVVA